MYFPKNINPTKISYTLPKISYSFSQTHPAKIYFTFLKKLIQPKFLTFYRNFCILFRKKPTRTKFVILSRKKNSLTKISDAFSKKRTTPPKLRSPKFLIISGKNQPNQILLYFHGKTNLPSPFEKSNN